MIYRQTLQKKAEYTQKRHDFTLVLANLIRHGADLIYFDETSLNSWIYKQKTWSHSYAKVEIPIN